MHITVWALVCLILSSTLASGDCVVQPQEDESVPQQFNFSAFRWDENNTTCPQKLPDKESKAILESLLDSSWVGNNTTYLQKVPDEKVEAVLGDLKPSIQKDYAAYIFFMPPLNPIVIVAEYVLQKWIEKKAKAKMRMGNSGFTCKCGVDYTKAMHMQDCCATVEKVWNGKTWEFHFANCEGGCKQKCDSQWEPKGPHPHWIQNICSKHAL
jgi:hypothetical protein